PAFATSLAEQNTLRTQAVPNPFGTAIHFAHGQNTPPPPVSAQVRTRKGPTFLPLATETFTLPTTPYDRYVGSGRSRGFVETAYLRMMIPIP
ncbi:MAG TPA: hypothetical protein VFO85_05210, partial [Vicinamibacteria bacterium]|nr:hypothetical protein [Vicinamibacteria bacterium]